MSSEGSQSLEMDPEMDLEMDCCTPDLTDVQMSAKNQIEDEYKRFMKKFNESLVKRNAELVEKGKLITVYEMDCAPTLPTPSSLVLTEGPTLTPTIKPTPTSALLATTQANLITNNNVLLTNGNVTSSPVFSPTTYQLVVSPRMGLIVSSPSGTATSASVVTNGAPVGTICQPLSTTSPRVQVRPGLGTLNAINNVNVVQSPKRFVTPGVMTSRLTVPTSAAKSTPVVPPRTSPVVTSVSSISTRNKSKQLGGTSESIPARTAAKATDASSTVVDLTDDDGRPAADSREVALSRYPGKIYPSLVVVARPSLRVKEMTSSTITAERTQLDTKVKGILSNSATKFTEWLIQQGLVRSEQVCTNHPNGDVDPNKKLKLGMYSDVSKFPYSGGYIWISECCPQKFVSVFCNSIFEGAPHAPTILLKLMYHWSCQTNVHNIISWVKVDNLYIKNFFTNLRAVCTAAVCEKFGKLGGPGKKIEVGVISLGTTSQNGSVRQVKVEVLGVMDPVTKYVRLRAVEPVPNADKNHKLRFQRILEALDQWVHKSTIIVTDFTVDKAALMELGFTTIVQAPLNAYVKDNNRCVMDYLKRVVPRMFQNTLSLLSKSIIQQFLDELVWRERWGAIPSRAFDNLILHLSEMTRLDTGDTLINRLKSITLNPFRDWSYRYWRPNCIVIGQQVKRSTSTAEGAKVMMVKAKSNTPASGSSRSVAKNVSAVPINDVGSIPSELPSIDNLPPSITEVDDDGPVSASASSSNSSSRRSRNRTTTVGTNLMTASVSAEDSKFRGHVASSTSMTDNGSSFLVSLENYYYGTISPDTSQSLKSNNRELNMKSLPSEKKKERPISVLNAPQKTPIYPHTSLKLCFHCGLTYNNNIEMMKHLAGHAQDEGAFTPDYRCKYCFKNFTNEFDLEDHVGKTHQPNKYTSMCYICLERYPKRSDLIRHMQWVHTELELPYQCSICKFRSSMHTAVVDHFYEVHNGCEKVQCPFCLKIVSFETGNGSKIPQNVSFFYNHLQRHQAKTVRKCSKCVLCFMNKNLVKEHLAKDHVSCVETPGVVRYNVNDLSSTLMSLPVPAASGTRKGKPVHIPLPSYSTYQLADSLYYPEAAVSKCLECRTDMSAPSQHFTTLYNCMSCRFSSCCKTMMTKHIRKIHDPKMKRRASVHKAMPVPEPLYCACGFSTSCGNTMAAHLITCRRKVAYPSLQRATQFSMQMQSATFPALVNLDDMEQQSSDPSERWMQAFVRNSASGDGESKRPARSEPSPPRMLKLLGLVRKGPNDNSGRDPDNMSSTNAGPPVKRTRRSSAHSQLAGTSSMNQEAYHATAADERSTSDRDRVDEPVVDSEASKIVKNDSNSEKTKASARATVEPIIEERNTVDKDDAVSATEPKTTQVEEKSDVEDKVGTDDSGVTVMECEDSAGEPGKPAADTETAEELDKPAADAESRETMSVE